MVPSVVNYIRFIEYIENTSDNAAEIVVIQNLIPVISKDNPVFLLYFLIMSRSLDWALTKEDL